MGSKLIDYIIADEIVIPEKYKNNILIKKVATIDIGSNAIRLLISNVIRFCLLYTSDAADE